MALCIHLCHIFGVLIYILCTFVSAVFGYFTLSHSNIDKTPTVAVGGMTGTQFEERYSDRITDQVRHFLCLA